MWGRGCTQRNYIPSATVIEPQGYGRMQTRLPFLGASVKPGQFQRYSNSGEKMKAYWRVISCAIFMFAGLGLSNLWAEENASPASVLHIQQLHTTSQDPTYLATYQVLD